MNNPNQKPKFPLTLEQERLCSWMLIWQGGVLLALILLANFLPVNFGWIVVGMVPVMVDLYADWCTACHQFERETFSDERVRQSLAGYRLLRADVSAPGEAQQTLLQRLQVPGLPAILFFDGVQTTGRIDGFLPADAFLDALPRCDNHESC